jgi:hypothetical protein
MRSFLLRHSNLPRAQLIHEFGGQMCAVQIGKAKVAPQRELLERLVRFEIF